MRYSFKIMMSTLIAVVLLSTVDVAAQDEGSIDRDVDVVNTYMPTIVNPFKLQVSPTMDDTMSYRPSFRYRTIQKLQHVATKPDSLRAATMTFRQDENPYHALVRAAGGNYTSFMGEILYNIGLSEKYHLSLDLGHHSMLGKVRLTDDTKVKAPKSDTWAGVDFATYFKKTILKTKLKFANDRYQYYGLNTIDPEAMYLLGDGETSVAGEELLPEKQQALTMFDMDVSVANSRVNPRKQFTYRADVGFGLFNNKTDISQFDLRADGNICFPIKTHCSFDANLKFNYFKVGVPAESTSLYTFAERQHYDIQVNPHFGIGYERVKMLLGVNLIFEIGGESDNIYMQPDIKMDFNIADDIVSFQVGIVGGYKSNSFRQIVKDNRYVASDACNYVWKASTKSFVEGFEMPTTQYPICFQAGIKSKFSRQVEMHLGIDYHSFDNDLYYVNKGYTSADDEDVVGYTNVFGLIAENGKLFTASGELYIRPTTKSSVLMKAKYYKSTLNYLEESWYKPKYELGLDARLYPIKRLLITAGLDVFGKCCAYNQTLGEKEVLPMLIDANITGEYYLTSRWTAYLQVKNVAARDYVRWLGYSSHRFNAMAGVTYKF